MKHEALVANEQLYRLANHDPLTGLLNRAAFAAAANDLLAEANAARHSLSLFLVGLDHFKSINDTLGHGAGDDVLRKVAERLRSIVGPKQVVGRLGGDEFAVLLSGGDETGIDLTIADRMIADTCGLFDVAGSRVTIGLSIGIATFPADCDTADDLLAHADLALYAAKDAGRKRCRLFDKTLLAAAAIARDLENDLHQALDDGSLEVWYQPQMLLRGPAGIPASFLLPTPMAYDPRFDAVMSAGAPTEGRLVGLEALIRWRHPHHGWIAPPSIVAAAARIHKSDALTGCVLMNACATIRRISDAGFDDVVVAVNVSPAELDQYPLADLVRRELAVLGTDPRRLEVEITEESLVSGERALSALRGLSALGVRIAIDDFGTGFSSLGYLRSMAFDRVKIDRSFVTGFVEREDDRVLVEAILKMMQTLKIEVVAEGIETVEEALLLASFGCRVGQGYYLSRPLEPQVLTQWLTKQQDQRVACRGRRDIKAVQHS